MLTNIDKEYIDNQLASMALEIRKLKRLIMVLGYQDFSNYDKASSESTWEIGRNSWSEELKITLKESK